MATTKITKVNAVESREGSQGQHVLASGTNVGMRLWSDETPADYKPESSRDYETVGYVLRGRAELRVEGESTVLEAGDSWVVPRGAKHSYKILETFSAIEATTPPAGRSTEKALRPRRQKAPRDHDLGPGVPNDFVGEMKLLRSALRFACFIALVGCAAHEPPRRTAGRAPAKASATTSFADAPVTTASALATPATPGVYQGRVIAETMGEGGADWLERPDREASEQPERVLDALGVRAGQRVADVGAGTGYFTVRLARRVGPGGRVVATDLQEGMLARLRRNVVARGLTNVSTSLVTDDDQHLSPASFDLVLLVDVYHELRDPSGTLAQLRASLAPGGRLALVEYRAEDPDVGIKPEHTMTLARLTAEVEPAGFRRVAVYEFLPKQRIVVFAPTT